MKKVFALFLDIKARLSLKKRYYQCEGYIDHIENGKLIGWVYKRTKPNKALKVDIYHDRRFLARIKADIFRKDLVDAGKGNGKHGFSYSFPPTLIPGAENELQVFYAGTTLNISRPVELLDKRKELSNRYIKGSGIEIGALHNPLWVPAKARVQYVDRMDLNALLRHYPELKLYPLTTPDIIDDGEQLNTFSDGSLDFIIMNHMIEHCENPIGTIRQHMKKLKKDGILYCTVPDMHFFADSARTLTSFDHLLRDDLNGPAWSRAGHYREWVEHWEHHIPPENVGDRVKDLINRQYSIHYHVWNEQTFREFLVRCRAILDSCFEIVHVEFNHTEIIAILKKN